MKLFLVRHGNTGKYVSCPSDEITEEAKKEMEELGRNFKIYNIPSHEMVIISGSDPRLSQSASSFALGAYPGNIPEMESLYTLNEKNYGEFFYGMEDSEKKSKLADYSWLPAGEKSFIKNFGDSQTETNEQVYIRAKDMYNKIIALYPNKNVVIVSSGGMLATLDFISRGLSFEKIQELPPEEYAAAVLKRGKIKEISRGPVV